MKKWLKKNIWWTTFIAVFAVGLLIVLSFCFFKDQFTLKQVPLSDWLSYFAACGTIGGFLYLIIDKITSEKEINHLKWQSEIPFVTLTSPCDQTSNYCDTNILEDFLVVEGRGNCYFSVCNLGKTNAFDIKILFYTKDEFIESNVFNRHYITYLLPLRSSASYQAVSDCIYSNYNVNPDTKEISNSKFEICGCLRDCQISRVNKDEKYFFAKIEYYSSLSKKHRYKIISTLKINVICQIEENQQQSVKIKGITTLDYEYE